MTNTNLKTKIQTSLDSFSSGYNCAQSVLTAYAEELNLDIAPTLELASGFGGGMGRLQKTCGAVTGSIMAIGIYNSRNITDNQKRLEETPKMIQNFNKEFVIRNGTTNCDQLLNCDLKTEEGQLFFKEKDLLKIVCQKCIRDSIEILEDIKSDHIISD